MEIAELRPFVRRIAGLFPQFPFDGGKAVFVRGVQFAGGNFQDDFVQRVTELPLHDDFAVIRDGDYADRPDVADDFAHGDAAVGQFHLIPFHMEDDAVKNIFGGCLFFPEAGEFGRFIKIHNSQIIIHNDIL